MSKTRQKVGVCTCVTRSERCNITYARVRADDCILCMACVTSCPTEAITVEEE